MDNMFYFSLINSIGGVESFFWYLAQKYEDKDIVIYYKKGSEDQINRLRKYVDVRKFSGERIKCKKAFMNYNTDIIDYVDADEYIQILHSIYPLNISPKITKVIAVSQAVADWHKKRTGQDIEVVYNPIVVQKPQKILRLISATRLSFEKGKERMVRFASLLDQKGVRFTWDVFTTDPVPINNRSIVFRKPKLNIIDEVASADWLVQLSDNEAYCYSVVEALSVGTPVVVTDCPVFHEIGVEHGKNGIILDHDFKDVPVSILRKGMKFQYTPIADDWDAMLVDGESEYKKRQKVMVNLEIIRPYFDLKLMRNVKKGETIKCNQVRAEELIDFGVGGEISGIV